MATVTPNFNWPVPTSTDLVRDGATAIEALGDSIDGSLVDLKGGTTGQVLSKTSGTDMDFTWVTTDDANAIQNSIVDAKGDLISATANDTPARLAVGANGETLVADSSTSTGLKYSGGSPVPNPLINSAMDIAQRGTSFTGISSGTTYTLDRWLVYLGAAASVSVSQQATGDTTNLPQIKNCARVGRPNGNTATTAINYGQIFENGNTSRYVGQVYNISFYARAGANFSSASSALTVYVNYGGGTDQSWAGGVNSNASISQAVTLTTTWQRFTAQVSGLSGLSATLAAAATQMAVGFQYTPVGTAGAADYFEVTGVQIDLGSTALPFRRNGATFQGELAACQRYYQRFGGTASSRLFPYTPATNTTNCYMIIVPRVTMRTINAIDYSNVQIYDGAATITVSSIGADINDGNTPNINVVGTGLTQYRTYTLLTVTTGYFALSAEL
jgi:hypothetical protein